MDSHFPLYRGTPIIANKNVMHLKAATGLIQTSHTYIITRSLSNESKHSIFIGRCQIYKNYITGDFPLMGPFGDT